MIGHSLLEGIVLPLQSTSAQSGQVSLHGNIITKCVENLFLLPYRSVSESSGLINTYVQLASGILTEDLIVNIYRPVLDLPCIGIKV